MNAEPNRVAAGCGVLSALLSVLGVALSLDIEGAYRPETLDRWFYAAQQHSGAAAWSAWSFTLSMALLVPWVSGLARAIGPYAWPGAALTMMAAIVNAGGSMLPFVVVTHLPHGEDVLGQTLLAIALTADALFNLLWGVSMVLLSLGMARATHLPMWLSGWGLVAGVMTMGVVGQAWTPVAADFLLLAGPVWLGWLVTTCAVMFRLPPRKPRADRDPAGRKQDFPYVARQSASAK
ncbi:MAG: hypothetical protein FJ102_00855 [Deltaproteobacteria bacterium]|nr:hypothetical protein [Deltaproteobacteria bacterium]